MFQSTQARFICDALGDLISERCGERGRTHGYRDKEHYENIYKMDALYWGNWNKIQIIR